MLLMTIFSYGHSVAQHVGEGPGGEIQAPSPCDDYPLPEMTIEVWSESFARAPHGTYSPYTIKPNNKFRVGLANYESGVTVVWQMPGAFIISEAQNPANGGYDEVYYAEFPANTNDRYIRATVSRLGCTAVLEYEVPNPNNNPNHVSNPFANWIMEDAGTNIVSYGNSDGTPYDASTVDIIESYSPINTNVVSYVKSSLVYQGEGSATISGRVVFGNLMQQGPGVTNLITRNTGAPGGQLGTKAIEIRVKAGFQLTIENAILQAAHGDMWKGIVVENGGTLYLKNVEIRDAFTAINCEEGTASLGNGIFIQGNDAYPQGRLRIYNCMNGLESALFQTTAQINNLTVRSTRHGFNRPFDHNFNTSTYNTSTKKAWFLTENAVQLLYPFMVSNVSITASNWKIDGAMVGIKTQNNIVKFNNAFIKNCQKMGVFLNNTNMATGTFELTNSTIEVPSAIDATFQKELTDQGTNWPSLLGTNTTDIFGIYSDWSGTQGHVIVLTGNILKTTASTTPKFAFSGVGFLDATSNMFENFSNAVQMLDGTVNPRLALNSNTFSDCAKGVVFSANSFTSGGKVTEFKCNKFVVNGTIPSGQTWYGLYNEYNGLEVNYNSNLNALISGANVFPIANESNRGNLPSGNANVNDLVGGWARKANWVSFANTATTQLVYQRFNNEHTGNTSGNVGVLASSDKAKTQTNQYNPNNVSADLVCSNLADKIYFPLAAPRVTEIDELTQDKIVKVTPNPFVQSFRVSAQRGDAIRCLTSTGKQIGLERKQVDEDQIELQLVDAPVGLYHLQIGTTYTKIIKQ